MCALLPRPHPSPLERTNFMDDPFSRFCKVLEYQVSSPLSINTRLEF